MHELSLNSSGTEALDDRKHVPLVDNSGEIVNSLLFEGVCVFDREGKIAYWNRGAEQFKGTDKIKVDLLGKTGIMLFF